MEDFVLNLLELFKGPNLAVIVGIGVLYVFSFWFVICAWIWFDARGRYEKGTVSVFVALAVFLLGPLGILAYLILRPQYTQDEHYWEDLERRYLKFEAEGLEDCPNCNTVLKPNYMHCPTCGEAIRRPCSGCKTLLEKEWRVCPYCGEKTKDEYGVAAAQFGMEGVGVERREARGQLGEELQEGLDAEEVQEGAIAKEPEVMRRVPVSRQRNFGESLRQSWTGFLVWVSRTVNKVNRQFVPRFKRPSKSIAKDESREMTVTEDNSSSRNDKERKEKARKRKRKKRRRK